ncbi:hypothetical protein IAU59_006213 [Kwoniella sp. CBS 9459]
MIPRALPYVNFAVAVSALGVQLGLLLPWHHVLSHEFDQLKAEQARQLAEHHQEKRALLDALHMKLEDLTKTVAPERFRQAGNSLVDAASRSP